MTTTAPAGPQAPAPASPSERPSARGRRARRAGLAVLALAAGAALAVTPALVSGWTPTGEPGPRVGSLADVPGGLPEPGAPGPVTSVPATAWTGSSAWPLRPASGTAALDTWVGRVADDDPAADYLEVHLRVTLTADAGSSDLRAPVRLGVTSDTAAIDNVHGATASFVSGAACDDLLALTGTGALMAPGSAAACPGHGATLTGADATSASWQVLRPAGVRRLDLVYLQKVPDGARPTWTVTLETPQGERSSVPWSAGEVTWTTQTVTVRG